MRMCDFASKGEGAVFYLEWYLATVVIYSDFFTSFSRVSYASPLRLKGNGQELNLGQPQLVRRFFSSCVPPFLIAERGTEAFEVRLCGWRKTGRVYKVTQQHIPQPPWAGRREPWERRYIYRTIKFTSERSETSIPFLDVNIQLHDGKIKTDLYCEPTDKHQHLLHSSSHQYHTKKSIPYSLALLQNGYLEVKP